MINSEFRKKMADSWFSYLQMQICKSFEQLENNKLKFNLLKRGTMWFDAGTPDSLIRASNYIQAFEKQTGIMIGCYEEAALERGFTNKAKLKRLCSKMPSSNYKSYLLNLIN